ncbi:MAG: diguanylate cyclase/phosphodiesterase & domain with sensor(s), partial [Frankiales bacterium]|nr:diguanylate cyclase/phosphodiesterase & domain with sensor(s) [Frankiales bacterium]
SSSAAVAVFTAFGATLHGSPARLVLASLAAAATAAAVDSLGVSLVIAVTSGEPIGWSGLRFAAVCVWVSACSSMLGQLFVAALAVSLWLLPAVLVVVAAALAVFWHLSRVRTRHDDVATLYAFSEALVRTDPDDLVGALLRQTADLLRAERAELWLVLDDGRLQWSRLSQGTGVRTSLLDRADMPALIGEVLGGTDVHVLSAFTSGEHARELLTQQHARDGVIAPMGVGQGVLCALDRQGEVATFTATDARLLLSLTGHSAVALANAQLVERLNFDSTHDSLTGLLNRSGFRARLEHGLAGSSPLAVLLMDLDRFKEVNDTLGHHHGDLLLQHIARRLENVLRPTDVLARLGGDEFAVLVRKLDEQSVLELVERLQDALTLPLQLQGVDIEVGASIGVVLVEGTELRSTADAESIMQQVDVAMYAAKREGAGVQVYRDAMNDSSLRRLSLAGSLRSAIDERQFFLHYQPQVSLQDGRITGAEALLRWDHPTLGSVSPDEFIALAEQGGLIRELTRYVLDVALTDCAVWAAAGHPMAVSVNVSVRNLLEPDLAELVAELLALRDVPSSRLTLEITETHVMADPERTAQVLEDLADLGVSLSIDDFGTGYSSLAYLRRLPVSEVKIDRTFVADLSRDDTDTAIVEAITQLGHTLGLSVVAEGVEDQATQARLAALGCDTVQGYYIARPMSHVKLLSWMSAQPDVRSIDLPAPRQADPDAAPIQLA